VQRGWDGKTRGRVGSTAFLSVTIIGFTRRPVDKAVRSERSFKVVGFNDNGGQLDKYAIEESIQG
jgi:hypothetical protein